MSFGIDGPYTYADGPAAGGQVPQGTKYRSGWRLHYIHGLWLLGALGAALWIWRG